MSSISKMRSPETMARWSEPYSCVRVRTGSKNRWMNNAKATRIPGWMVSWKTMYPPKKTTSASPRDVRISTVGSRAADRRLA